MKNRDSKALMVSEFEQRATQLLAGGTDLERRGLFLQVRDFIGQCPSKKHRERLRSILQKLESHG